MFKGNKEHSTYYMFEHLYSLQVTIQDMLKIVIKQTYTHLLNI